VEHPAPAGLVPETKGDDAVISFIDGPAHGKTLMLKRAPVFLRVTLAHYNQEEVQIDALDRLDDKPDTTESLFAYRLVKHEGNAFVDGRDPKTGKRWGSATAIATYRLVETQPDDATMRNYDSWKAWCEATWAAEKESKPPS
jgi:hypothetical protein